MMHVIYVHGWSANHTSLRSFAGALQSELAHVPLYADYKSRESQANIDDFAEGLMSELMRLQREGTLPTDAPLNFVTHSTGALVVRAWLKRYYRAAEAQLRDVAQRTERICYIAPPNFGSHVAHKGRSWLGSLAKGRRDNWEDWGETGTLVLQALELASPQQWELAHFDLFDAEHGTLYGKQGVFATVITGASGYDRFPARMANSPGTDGTIVVPGAGLNCRKYNVRIQRDGGSAGWLTKNKHQPDVPLLIFAAHDHATIIDPGTYSGRNARGDVVAAAQAVLNPNANPAARLKQLLDEGEIPDDSSRDRFQQFVFRLKDDRGAPIQDYFLDFAVWEAARVQQIDGKHLIPPQRPGRMPSEKRKEVQLTEALKELYSKSIHKHSVDGSLRRFMVKPQDLMDAIPDGYVLALGLRIVTGDKDIEYETDSIGHLVIFDPTAPASKRKIDWFYPDTTTLVEITCDRFTKLMKIMNQ